jgi:hypothetical protein
MKNFINFKKAIVLLLILLFSYSSFSQDRKEPGKVAKKISELVNSKEYFESFEPFKLSKKEEPKNIFFELGDFTLLELDNYTLNQVLTNQPDLIKIKIPIVADCFFEFLLFKENILSEDFVLQTEDNCIYKTNERIVHYRGIVNGNPFSIASFTFSENEIIGFYSDDNDNVTIGKLLQDNRYVMYGDVDLVDIPNYSCEKLAIPDKKTNRNLNNNLNGTTSVNCVNFYYEVDYDIFLNKGSVSNVNTYIQGAFNQVATLYANDGIDINLSTIFVWTSTDPYTGPSTSNFLNQFGNYRTSFNGDLAHLVGYTGSGGIAYVDGLCSSQSRYKMAYSDINSTYQNVPTYSWTINVLAHEQGHLLGSYHTHDCVWNGNNTAIDGCGPTAGYSSGSCPTGPLPSNGGTIMSYCHLLSSVGINFSNGFGPQPTNVMLNNINTSSCLTPCVPCPAKPDTIIGPRTICSNISSSATYTCTPVQGATSYTWTLPNGWIGNSLTNTITVNAGSNNGHLVVVANNSCGTSPAESLFVWIKTPPSTPSKIKGNFYGVCNSAEIYSINEVGGVQYNWSFVGSGGIIAFGQGTDSIYVNFGNGFTETNLQVNASNVCGTSSNRTQTIKLIPKIPGTISGNISPCLNQQLVPYSITPVYGAINYEWSAPFGSTISAGNITSTNNKLITPFTNVAVNFGTNSTNGIRVKSINACGQSFNKSLSISFSCRKSKNIIEEQLDLFPNPSSGKIQINISNETIGYYRLKIYDTNQREVYSEYVFINQDMNSIFLDLDNLKNGLYHLVISNDQESINSRFIINK